MKKLIISLLCLIMIISGCNTAPKQEVIKICLSRIRLSWWNEEVKDQARIDAINERLKEKGKNYKIELCLFPGDYNPNDVFAIDKATYDKMVEEEIDLAYCDVNIPMISYFMELNEYMNSDKGKKLRKEIPDKVYKVNLIKGKSYYIPKPALGFSQYFLGFDEDYYKEENITKEEVQKDVYQFLKNKIDTYQPKDNKVLFTELVVDDLLGNEYDKISGVNLYIRRSDQQIINPLENEVFLKYYDLIIDANLKGCTGRFMSDEEWDKFNESGIRCITNSSLYCSDDNDYGINNVDKYEIPIRDVMIPVQYSGYGILKSSKHQDSAFDFLCEMHCDQVISDLFIYGVNPKKDEQGKVKENCNETGWYFDSLGNDLISTPSIYQKSNKKEIVFKADEMCDESYAVNTIFDFSEMIDLVDRVNGVDRQFEKYLNSETAFNTKEEMKECLNKQLKALKEAGMDELIAKLQEQVDNN